MFIGPLNEALEALVGACIAAEFLPVVPEEFLPLDLHTTLADIRVWSAHVFAIVNTDAIDQGFFGLVTHPSVV
jgi:hypothetical protein